MVNGKSFIDKTFNRTFVNKYLDRVARIPAVNSISILIDKQVKMFY